MNILFNPLDRRRLTAYSRPALRRSNALLGAAVALPPLLDLADVLISRSSGKAAACGRDALLLAVTQAASLVLAKTVKRIVGRRRPLAYNPLALLREGAGQGDRSFYSEHTASTFAMATAYTCLLARRHRDWRVVLPLALGPYALAGATACLRVRAGKHFWTDVLTGAAAGSAVALLAARLCLSRYGVPAGPT